MDFTNFWFPKKQDDPGDPGDPIGQSLRFRGAQFLKGPHTTDLPSSAAGQRSTFSFWFKRGDTDRYQALFNFYHSGYFTITAGNQFVGYAGNSGDHPTPNKFRDQSGWVHVVSNSDGTPDSVNNKLWINGVDVTGTLAGADMPTFVGYYTTEAYQYLRIGSDVNETNNFSGYMADVYAIDGQCLPATAFGRYNRDGVWVPSKVDFTASPDALKYSDFLIPTVGDAGPSGDMQGAFVGDLAGPRYAFTAPGGQLTFAPDPPIPFTRLRCCNANTAGFVDFTWNGNSVTSLGPGVLATVFEGAGEISSTTPLTVNPNGGSWRAELSAIEITDDDGTRILLDPFIYSLDLYYDAQDPANADASNPPNFNSTVKYDDVNVNGANYIASTMFDKTNLHPQSPANNDCIIWRPSQTIVANNKIRVFIASGASGFQRYYVNGVNRGEFNTGSLAGTWLTLAEPGNSGGLEFPITIETIGLKGYANTSSGFVAQVEIDGQKVLNGVNQSFGQHGFHLDFSDPDDLGADRSGNGNHFTATGFDTAPVGIWSDMFDLAPDFGGFEVGRERQYMFDGDISTWTQVATGATNDDEIIWEPNNPIAYTQLEYYNRGARWTLTQEDGTVTTGGQEAGGAVDWTVIDASPGTLRRLVFVNTGVGSAAVGGLRINGDTILVDNPGSTYDLVLDSPTQNWATWNRQAAMQAYTTLSNGMLTTKSVGGANWTPNYLTYGPFECGQPGKYYIELNDDDATGYKTCNFGVTNLYKTSDQWTGFWWDEGDTLSWYPENGVYYRNGVSSDTQIKPGGTSGGKGMTIDFETGEVIVYDYGNDNTWNITDLSSPLTDGEKYYIVAGTSVSGDTNIPFNFGQQPWRFNPPEGFTGIQSNELPAPPIFNGRDHFQVITAPGSGTVGAGQRQVNSYTNPTGFLNNNDGINYSPSQAFDGQTTGYFFVPTSTNYTETAIQFDTPMTGTQFRMYVSISQSGFMVNGNLVSGNQTGWVDVSTQAGGSLSTIGFSASGSASDGFSAMEIDGEIIVEPGILSQAQQTFPNGLWWIKDRQYTNDHQMVYTGSNGNAIEIVSVSNPSTTPYTAPTGNSVAWCWKAGDSEVANNDGSIASNVRVNETAGFSIVRFTGTETAGSVGHGLEGDIDFMIITPYDYNSSRYVWSRHQTSQAYYLYLQNNDPESNVADLWGSNDFDNGIFSVSSSVETNKNGNEMVAFCWKSIPGYSSFGRYDGNSNTDGPFIYTGFKPAFVMIKRLTAVDHWHVYDTTRGVINPVGPTLYPSLTFAEQSVNYLDINSNGFKIQTDQSPVNLGSVYLYACFAENPFQSPTTAR